MARFSAKDYLNHYFNGYRSKLFANEDIDDFVLAINNLNIMQTEEGIKHDFSKILKECFGYNTVANHKNIDLSIFSNSKPHVIIEFKTPNNNSEMPSPDRLLSKALCETIWYFHSLGDNSEIYNIIITNGKSYYFIDPEKYNNKSLSSLCVKFKQNKLASRSTSDLYQYIRNELVRNPIDFDYSVLDISADSIKILYKLFHPDFLLKNFTYRDSNQLNKNFYNELLYILGLKENKTQGKLQIVETNQPGTLSYRIRHDFSVDDFEIILNILTVWLNRIIFLKLFDSQLAVANSSYSGFFNSNTIKDFQILNNLFFNILGKPQNERTNEDNRFADVPYLNSSLFERSEYEQAYGNISNLNNYEIAVKSNSVLKQNPNYPNSVPLIRYFLDFLDSYNFTNINSKSKEIIDTSVLGLIFEKLNGYKDGSYFTPSFITSYISKQTIDRVVLDKFNKCYSLQCSDIEELKNYLYSEIYKSKKKAEFNALFDSIRVIDISVGSGHFLVSCLNYFVYLKHYLGLLNNALLDGCVIDILDDNLVILRPDGIEHFVYRRNVKKDLEIQKYIFNVKQSIIKNCLFGADINPKSVEICRLRLWIELLKHSYYRSTDLSNNEMETLPNIDINIKCGNSLTSILKPSLGKSFFDMLSFKLSEFDYTKYFKLINDYRDAKNLSKSKIKKELKALHSELIHFIESDNSNIEYMIDFPDVLNDKAEFQGFDIVVGNPPYMKEIDHNSIFEIVRATPLGDRYSEGKMNYWYYFFHQGMDILKDGGVLSFIAPNYYLSGYGASKLNSRIVNHSAILGFVDFNKFQVFENANVQCMILSVIKSNPQNNSFNAFVFNNGVSRYDVQSAMNNLNNSNHVKRFSILNQNSILSSDFTINFEFSQFHDILNKINSKKSTDQLFKATQGIVENPSIITNKLLISLAKKGIDTSRYCADDFVFVIPRDKLESLCLNDFEMSFIREYHLPGEISGYCCSSDFNYYILYCTKHNLSDIDLCPNIKKHLIKFKPIMELRRETVNGTIKWFQLHWPRNEEVFHGEKIVYPQMSKIPVFAYDSNDYYVNMSSNIIKPVININLKSLTAVLNSNLAHFWLLHHAKNRGAGLDISVSVIDSFPVNIDILNNLDLLHLSDKIITEASLGKDFSDLRERIDKVIYSIYGITESEIEIIENYIKSRLHSDT